MVRRGDPWFPRACVGKCPNSGSSGSGTRNRPWPAKTRWCPAESGGAVFSRWDRDGMCRDWRRPVYKVCRPCALGCGSVRDPRVRARTRWGKACKARSRPVSDNAAPSGPSRVSCHSSQIFPEGASPLKTVLVASALDRRARKKTAEPPHARQANPAAPNFTPRGIRSHSLWETFG